MSDNTTATDQRIRLQIPSRSRYVALARQTVFLFCRTIGMDIQSAFKMKLLCGEALNNIIKHAYDGRPDMPIFIEMLRHKTFIELRLRDFGRRSPISSSMARDMSDYREKGLGVYLISKLSDYHYYDRSGDTGTTLILKKKIDPNAMPLDLFQEDQNEPSLQDL